MKIQCCMMYHNFVACLGHSLVFNPFTHEGESLMGKIVWCFRQSKIYECHQALTGVKGLNGDIVFLILLDNKVLLSSHLMSAALFLFHKTYTAELPEKTQVYYGIAMHTPSEREAASNKLHHCDCTLQKSFFVELKFN